MSIQVPGGDPDAHGHNFVREAKMQRSAGLVWLCVVLGCAQTAAEGPEGDAVEPAVTPDAVASDDALGAVTSTACATDADCASIALPCHAIACDLTAGRCRPTPFDDGHPCSDDDLCTTADACHDGLCVGVAATCDDGDPCSADGCERFGGCTHAATLGACEDGNPCTAGDNCVAGTCVTGALLTVCDDGNDCTTDSCTAATGCRHDAVSDGTVCGTGGRCLGASCTSALVVAGLTAGSEHACVVVAGGHVACWGRGGFGQLGDGNTVGRGRPVEVVGLGAPAVEVSAGDQHTCARLVTGAVECWGGNAFGQLGDGTTEARLSPTPVSGLELDVEGLVAGRTWTCARHSGGQVSCWGDNSAGQLGDGTTQARLAPAPVIGLDGALDELVALDASMCGRSASGGVSCWGRGYTPTARGVELARPATRLFALGDTLCAALDDGAIDCSNVALSSRLSELESLVAAGAGRGHQCTLFGHGRVSCWGDNVAGQAAPGSVDFTSLAPVDIPLAGLATGLSVGRDFACARLTSGAVQCWGDDTWGQRGDGAPDGRLAPGEPVPLGGPASQLDAGLNDTCAIRQDGTLWCWGEGGAGQLGDGAMATRGTPTQAAGLVGVTEVDAGATATCAIAGEGRVSCFGDNAAGHMSVDLPTTLPTPTDLSWQPMTHVAVAGASTCGSNNYIDCVGGPWNSDHSGFGYVSSEIPGAYDIVAGEDFGCAIGDSSVKRQLVCWGSHEHGQLGEFGGYGSPTTNPIGVSGAVASVAAGDHHACAVLTSGGVACWGANEAGQLGNGAEQDRQVPVAARGLEHGVVAVGAGRRHSCAVHQDGGLWCWGANDHGQLGLDGLAGSWSPVKVPGVLDAIAVSLGEVHTCVLHAGGAITCFGAHYRGQLGYGEPHDALAPPLHFWPCDALPGAAQPGGAEMVCGGDLPHDCDDDNPCTDDGIGVDGACAFTPNEGPCDDGDLCTNDDRCSDGLCHSSAPAPCDDGDPCTIDACVPMAGCEHAVAKDGENCGGGSKCIAGSCVARSPALTVVAQRWEACALLDGGELQCWGPPPDFPATSSHFVASPTVAKGVRSVSVNTDTTCTVSVDSRVRCWGYGYDMAMGKAHWTASDDQSPEPEVDVVPGIVGVPETISAGPAHACAVTTIGDVYCWGATLAGLVGAGLVGANPVGPKGAPVTVATRVEGLPGPAAAVSSGRGHACARLASGGVWCWGANYAGQLGDGTTVSRTTPSLVPGLESGVTALAAGEAGTCAVRDGRVWCFGQYAQVREAALVPTSLIGVDVEAVDVALDWTSGCLIGADSVVRCWGEPYDGKVYAPDSPGLVRLPRKVDGVPSGATAIAISTYQSCARLETGAIWCWGLPYAALGAGDPWWQRFTPTPPVVAPGAPLWASVEAGGMHTCAIDVSGHTSCWGKAGPAGLGIETHYGVDAPTIAPNVKHAVELAAGDTHTCARDAAGAVTCWGSNDTGQLGDLSAGTTAIPVSVEIPPAVAIDAGRAFTCALTQPGDVYCWGEISGGEYGLDWLTHDSRPTQVPGLGEPAKAIAAGPMHACALLSSGAVMCWGWGMDGQLGQMAPVDGYGAAPPSLVTGLPGPAIAISASQERTCASLGAAGVYCWGTDYLFTDGYSGLGGNVGAPRRVPGLSGAVTALAATNTTTCGLLSGGAVVCWGATNGALGYLWRDMNWTRPPTVVPSLSSGVDSLSAGPLHICARLHDGSLRCWGDNGSGQIGDGTAFRPVEVEGFWPGKGG